jgi:hypothetical protein
MSSNTVPQEFVSVIESDKSACNVESFLCTFGSLNGMTMAQKVGVGWDSRLHVLETWVHVFVSSYVARANEENCHCP